MLQYDSFVSHIVCAVYWLENAQILDPEATKLDPNAIKVTYPQQRNSLPPRPLLVESDESKPW